MTDDDLRHLERDLAATGAPAARLAYARALERVGRGDDALDAMRPGLDDVGVRREVARWPAWGRNPHLARQSLDAPPLARAPRLAWVSRGPGGSGDDGILLVSELGVVALSGASLRLIDPASGRVQRQLPADSDSFLHAAPSLVRGELFVPGPTSTVALDLVTGGERTIAPLAQAFGRSQAQVDGPFALLAAGDELRGFVLAPDATSWTPAWTARPGIALGGALLGAAQVSASRVLLRKGARHELLDRASGRRVFQREASASLDEQGVLAVSQRTLVASDEGGAEQWRRPGVDHVRASSPDVVIVVEVDVPRATLTTLDRETGARIARLGVFPWAHEVIVARDRIHLVTRRDEDGQEVSALTPEGEVAWSVSFDALTDREVLALAPLARRLLVLVDGGTVFCLEDGP